MYMRKIGEAVLAAHIGRYGGFSIHKRKKKKFPVAAATLHSPGGNIQSQL